MPRAPKRRNTRRRHRPMASEGGFVERPVTEGGTAPRCDGCSLYSLDLVDGQCARCRKGKRPMTPSQVEFVQEQVAMRAAARTSKARRRFENTGRID